MSRSDKLVIIPAYNESECIVETVNEIREKAPEFDYVVINDCSKDDTLKICREHGFTVLNEPINLGIGGAVQTGYRYAFEHGYKYAVQVDGDGQHDPKYLSKMVQVMDEAKADMVIGSRFIEKEGFQSSVSRRMGIKILAGIINFLTGQHITDPTSGLRMIGERGIRLFAEDYPVDYPEPESIVFLIRHDMEIVETPVIMRERMGGVSSISLRKGIYYMLKVTYAILIERLRKYEGDRLV